MNLSFSLNSLPHRKPSPLSPSPCKVRPVLGPAGNKARSVELRKPIGKLNSEKVQKSQDVDDNEKKTPAMMQSPVTLTDHLALKLDSKWVNGHAASILRQQKPNLSLTASCSSDASTDSSHSPSTGRISGWRVTLTPTMRRKQQCSPKAWNAQMSFDGESEDMDLAKKRCAWVTSNTGMLGTAAFAFFCFYLLLAVIAGAMMLGLKLVFITIHRMKWAVATFINRDKKCVGCGWSFKMWGSGNVKFSNQVSKVYIWVAMPWHRLFFYFPFDGYTLVEDNR